MVAKILSMFSFGVAYLDAFSKRKQSPIWREKGSTLWLVKASFSNPIWMP